MDISYGTILVFGEQRRLYIEVKIAYMVSNKDKSVNYPIYSVETELGSSIFYNDSLYEEENWHQEILLLERHSTYTKSNKKIDQEGLWSLHFDGAMSIVGAGASAWISSPNQDVKLLSLKLYFECTNNVAEYESLILGLNALKTMKARRIAIYGDSELIIDQVKGIY